jgi:hypothetical protein
MSPTTEPCDIFVPAGASSSVDTADSRDDERPRRLINCCESMGAAGWLGGSTLVRVLRERLEEHDLADIAAAYF